MTYDLLKWVDLAIEALEVVVKNRPIDPVQPGTPYDDAWIGLMSLRRASQTMHSAREHQTRMNLDGQIK